jgi:hypothetical protein
MQPDTSSLATILSTYATACEHLRTVTADALLVAFAEQFAANPAVKCMIWTQYTPYFNDGDPCTFRVCSEDPCRSRLPQADELTHWDIVAGAPPPADPTPYPAQPYKADFLDRYEYVDPVTSGEGPEAAQGRALDVFVNGLPEELLARVIGDGVKVFVWEGGILTTEYGHD